MSEEHNNIPPSNPEEELNICKQKQEEYLAGWQRAKADFVNYKRDEMKRYEELARYASEDLMEELIGVLDNFDFAIATFEAMKSAPTPAETGSESRPFGVGIEKGVYMIRTQIEDILKKRGLTRIPFSIGEPFDPAVHEAIAEGESEHPPGTVIEELSPGYRLHDKVIRPTRVKITKGHQEKNQA